MSAAAVAGKATSSDRAALSSALVDLITAVGNSSNLVLDPDLDSFYVMDALDVQLPKLLLAAAQQTDIAGVPEGTALVAHQAVLAGTISGSATSLADDLETALASTADGALAPDLATLTTTSTAWRALSQVLTDGLASAEAADPTAVSAAAEDAIDDGAAALDRLLTTRERGLASERNLTLAATALGLVLAAWLAAGVWWRTRRDVTLTVRGVEAIATGDLEEYDLPAGRDELGDVGRALAVARHQMARDRLDLARSQAAREDQLHDAFIQQRMAEKQARQRAQTIIDETSSAVVGQLDVIGGQVDAVRDAATLIEARVGTSSKATQQVVARAGQADEVVAALAASLHRVAGIAALISGVADQTKLLALNATIEAARAGSAGRGFAVVAGEVKELAAETATSTGQIAVIIATLEADAAAVAAAILAMSQGIIGVDSATAELNDVAEQQHQLVEDLTRSLRLTTERIETMSELSDQLERRSAERVPSTDLVARLTSAGGRVVEATVSDLSEGGVRVLTSVRSGLNVADLIGVEIEIGGRKVAVRATLARCVVNADGGETMGVHFLSTPADVTALLKLEIGRRTERTLAA